MRLVLTILIAAGIFACRGTGPVVSFDDPGLTSDQGPLYYKGKPFTGTIRREIPALKEIHKSHFRAGFEHGISTEETDEGFLVASRSYTTGAKNGVHRSWHRNGKPRSYAEFRMGKYVGEAWEWHDNGLPYNYALYDDNGQLLAEKRWRETGQIYMNNVFQNGVAVGLPGSKLCNPANPGGKAQ